MLGAAPARVHLSQRKFRSYPSDEIIKAIGSIGSRQCELLFGQLKIADKIVLQIVPRVPTTPAHGPFQRCPEQLIPVRQRLSHSRVPDPGFLPATLPGASPCASSPGDHESAVPKSLMHAPHDLVIDVFPGGAARSCRHEPYRGVHAIPPPLGCGTSRLFASPRGRPCDARRPRPTAAPSALRTVTARKALWRSHACQARAAINPGQMWLSVYWGWPPDLRQWVDEDRWAFRVAEFDDAEGGWMAQFTSGAWSSTWVPVDQNGQIGPLSVRALAAEASLFG